MTTVYHVADPSYQQGEDLLCWQRLADAGQAPAWKWADADEGADGDVVCVFPSLAEAREFRSDWQPAGLILAIEIDDDMRLTTVGEGYQAIRYAVPAYAIKAVPA